MNILRKYSCFYKLLFVSEIMTFCVKKALASNSEKFYPAAMTAAIATSWSFARMNTYAVERNVVTSKFSYLLATEDYPGVTRGYIKATGKAVRDKVFQVYQSEMLHFVIFTLILLFLIPKFANHRAERRRSQQGRRE